MRKALILLALIPALAFGQAVNTTFTLPASGGVRATNPDFGVTFLPEWHALNDPDSSAPAGFTFTTSVAIADLDFGNYTSPPDGYEGTGTIVVTVQSGTLPTGLTLTNSVLSGTPTVDNGDVTFRATMDGATTADQLFAFTLQGTDTTAPAAPTNLECSPTNGSTTTSITCVWDVVTDPSEPVVYPVRYAATEALCNSADNGDNTFIETSSDTTASLGGLTASTTRWFKVRSQDDIGNQGNWASCVSGTTADGGTPTVDLFADEFDTGPLLNDTYWNESVNVAGSGSCTSAVTNGYASFTLVANPTGGDAGGGSYRCEEAIKSFLSGDTTSGVTGLIEEGDTVYYGMAYRMPAATPYDPLKGDTLTQIFQNIGGGLACHEVINIDNNIVKWKTQDCIRPQGQEVLLSPLAKDTWVNICQVYKWESDNTGFHKVWVNPTSEASTPVINYSGQTLIDDIGGTPDPEPYYIGKVKIGVYKTGWRTTVGNATNQEEMSPRVFHIGYVRIASTFDAACGDPL